MFGILLCAAAWGRSWGRRSECGVQTFGGRRTFCLAPFSWSAAPKVKVLGAFPQPPPGDLPGPPRGRPPRAPGMGPPPGLCCAYCPYFRTLYHTGEEVAIRNAPSPSPSPNGFFPSIMVPHPVHIRQRPPNGNRCPHPHRPYHRRQHVSQQHPGAQGQHGQHH